jgi:hypothetical protein
MLTIRVDVEDWQAILSQLEMQITPRAAGNCVFLDWNWWHAELCGMKAENRSLEYSSRRTDRNLLLVA